MSELSDVLPHLDYLAVGDVHLGLGGVGHCHVEKIVVNDGIVVETVGGKC